MGNNFIGTQTQNSQAKTRTRNLYCFKTHTPNDPTDTNHNTYEEKMLWCGF